MALVTKILTERVNIPHEAGEWMVFRKLSANHLALAREAQMGRVLRNIGHLGDAAKAFAQVDREVADRAAEVQDAQDDPYTHHDGWIVCQYGIAEWSYDSKLNKEAIYLLDEETLEWAAREVLTLSLPKPKDDAKAQEKNGYAPSTLLS